MTQFQIEPHAVHVWRFLISDHSEAELRPLLNADELARADRFHFEKDRCRFTVARGLLRQVLGYYLRQNPQQIQFNYSSRGKPSVENPEHIFFNISHSDNAAVIALTRDHEIGVDIEKIQDKSHEGIAKRFFTEREYQALIALPREEQLKAFYQLWSAKEAVIKALGEGLFLGLDDFEISLATPKQWVMLEHHSLKKIYLEMFEVFPEYCSAVATDQAVEKIIYCEC